MSYGNGSAVSSAAIWLFVGALQSPAAAQLVRARDPFLLLLLGPQVSFFGAVGLEK